MDQKKREFLEALRRIDPGNPIFINPFLSEEKKEEMIENGVNKYNFGGMRVDDIERNMEIKKGDDEKVIQFKKRYKEIKEAWRKGETVVFGKKHQEEEDHHEEESENAENRTGTLTDKEPTALEKVKMKWNNGMAKRFLIKLEQKGIIMPKGDTYDWKIDSDNGYGYNLYVYFVYMASEKLGWRKGKNKDRMPWDIFNPMFPNVSKNQNANNQYLIVIKNNVNIPSKAYLIDEILK